MNPDELAAIRQRAQAAAILPDGPDLKMTHREYHHLLLSCAEDVPALLDEVASLTAAGEALTASRRQHDAARTQAEAERDDARADYQRACETIAAMHEAATGRRGDGPTLGVVEDVAAVRVELETLRTQCAELDREADDLTSEMRSRGRATRSVRVERDEARAEAVELREALTRLQPTSEAWRARQAAETAKREADTLRAERDEARAEVAHLRGTGRESDGWRRYGAHLRDERDSLAAKVARVRLALSNYPDACEKHPCDDPVVCGWKRAVQDARAALDGEAPLDDSRAVPRDSIVIDPADLPEAIWQPTMRRWETTDPANGSWADPKDDDHDADWYERQAHSYLALARALRADPPVDEGQVKALTDLLWTTEFDELKTADARARYLVARGVQTMSEVEDRG